MEISAKLQSMFPCVFSNWFFHRITQTMEGFPIYWKGFQKPSTLPYKCFFAGSPFKSLTLKWLLFLACGQKLLFFFSILHVWSTFLVKKKKKIVPWRKIFLIHICFVYLSLISCWFFSCSVWIQGCHSEVYRLLESEKIAMQFDYRR